MDKEDQNSSFSKGNFVGLHRGEETDALQRRHPAAYLLLNLIARRARYSPSRSEITDLGYGQAFIGDYKEAGLTTRSQYRSALERLEKLHLCAFKGTKTGANRGTVATLLPQGIFSIDKTGTAIRANNEQPTNDQRTTNERPQTTKEPANQGNHELSNTPPISPKGDLEKVKEIYQAYPKKVNESSALKAITKALKKTDYETLLERTKAYAKAREGENDQYTPHPENWFNKERFNDKPSTWKSSPSTTSNQPRQTVADLMNGKKTDIINAAELNHEPIQENG